MKLVIQIKDQAEMLIFPAKNEEDAERKLRRWEIDTDVAHWRITDIVDGTTVVLKQGGEKQVFEAEST